MWSMGTSLGMATLSFKDSTVAEGEYRTRCLLQVAPVALTRIYVDGVAPRAKMNQQRSRRFRSVQEAKEKDEDKEQLIQMLRSQKGEEWWEQRREEMSKKTWDSNQITPGTPFMFMLAACLRYWCALKLNSDPAWETVRPGFCASGSSQNAYVSAGQSDHLRCKCSGRRRAQNHGVHPLTA